MKAEEGNVRVPPMMRQMEGRIHAVNAQAKAQGAQQPFTTNALRELAPKDVERFLTRFEKAGPDKVAMESITRQVRDFERQGPKLGR